MDFQTLYNYVLARLRQDLPRYFTYHSAKHTEYVVKKAEYIARKEGVSEAEVLLVKTAALYHDIGFLKSAENHEEIGCEIVRTELAQNGFSDKQIEQICGMIMATKIPQNPQNLLERILADADLEYLATNNYSVVSNLLYFEIKHFNPKFTQEDWKSVQINFLKEHTYHTSYCKKYKAFRKRRNLEKLL